MEELGVVVAEPGDNGRGRHVGGDGGFAPRLQGAAQRPCAGAGLGFGVFGHRIDFGEGRAAVLVQG